MTNPKLITTAFAENGTANDIPESSAAEPQLATMTSGFPEVTQKPIAEGGIPPERADFNGILKLYGQHIVHLNKGLGYEFDADFATAIGGYPLHARIVLTNGNEVKNTIPANTTNPNTDMTGWELTGGARTDAQLITWSGRTQEEKNKDIKSIYDFKLGSDSDFSTALSRAFEKGFSVYIPHGDFDFSSKVELWHDNVTLFGSGRLIWDGTGGAGSTCIDVKASNFTLLNLKHQCSDVRRIFYRVSNDQKDISNIYAQGADFKDGFYGIRTGLVKDSNPNNTLVKNLKIIGCSSNAPIDVPAGHFLSSGVDGLLYLGLTTNGGRNTAALGVNFSTNIKILGCSETGVTPHGIGGAEASIQIEDSDNANAIIANNVCTHDIWISGANGVDIHDNNCNGLRVTVGNPHGSDINNTVFKDNHAGFISVVKYGSLETDKTYSAIFDHNTIDPQKALRLGRAVPTRAVAIGGSHGKDILLKNNKVISSASQYQASLIRSPSLRYTSTNNDWGVGSNILSGTGGYVSESKVANPLIPVATWSPSSSIAVAITSNKPLSGTGNWSKFSGFSMIKDTGVSFSGGDILLPAGYFNVSWSLLFNASSRFGFRVMRGGSEVQRLIFENGDGEDTLRSGEFSIVGDSTITFEFFTNSSATLLGLPTMSHIAFEPS